MGVCSLFGVGVLVYSIVVGVLVSYNRFILSSVKREGGFVLVVRFTLWKFGNGEWVFGGGGAPLGVIRNHSLPGVDTKPL